MAKRRIRPLPVEIVVEWDDGRKEVFTAETEDTVEKRYRQLTLVDTEGNAILINLANVRSVKMRSDRIDFTTIDNTDGDREDRF